MCVKEYVGCPDCGEPANDEMRAVEYNSEIVSYHLEADGSVTYDIEPEYGDTEGEDQGYKCLRCPWEGARLDDHCVAEDCDCVECCPETVIENPPDPDEIICLRRTNHHEVPELEDDTSPEVRKLYSDRALTVIPIRAGRAAEIYAEEALDFIRVEVDPTPAPLMPLSLQVPEEATA